MAFQLDITLETGATANYHNFEEMVVNFKTGNITPVRSSYLTRQAYLDGAKALQKKQESLIPFPANFDITELTSSNAVDLLRAHVYNVMETRSPWSGAVPVLEEGQITISTLPEPEPEPEPEPDPVV